MGSFHRFAVRHTIYLACETGRNSVEAAEEQGEKCAKGAEAIHGPSVAWSVAGKETTTLQAVDSVAIVNIAVLVNAPRQADKVDENAV